MTKSLARIMLALTFYATGALAQTPQRKAPMMTMASTRVTPRAAQTPTTSRAVQIVNGWVAIASKRGATCISGEHQSDDSIKCVLQLSDVTPTFLANLQKAEDSTAPGDCILGVTDDRTSDYLCSIRKPE